MPTEKFRWVALILVVVMIIIHLLRINFQTQADNFVLISSEVLQRPWTLITYMFLHGDFTHLYFNMFALALFGSILESIIGYKKLLLIFISVGIVSGMVSIFFYSSVIGASGAIFGIIGILTVIRPKMAVLAMGIPMPLAFAAIIWALFDLLGTFYPDQIAHFGHLAGLGAGLAIGLALRKKYRLVEKKEEKIVISDKEFKKWEEKWMKKRKI